MTKTRDNLISNVLKADLLLSDYTLVTNPEDKDTTLELLGRYIYVMDDHKAVYLYSKICDSCQEEKDLYIEILIDHLQKNKSNLFNGNCA